MKAILALEDGSVFVGRSYGAMDETEGEIVFNTSMTGYQEVLTDPSYKGQIVIMTYPLIGNYGINFEDIESRRICVEGFIVREYSEFPSNWRSHKSLGEYLKEQNIVGIEGIDTRALTKKIRTRGVMQGIISTLDLDEGSVVQKAKKSLGLDWLDMVKEVTCSEIYEWKQGRDNSPNPRLSSGFATANSPRIVVLDCGVKYNILRHLVDRGCEVIVVPAHTSAEEILDLDPEGILLSNGPGDPRGVPYIVETVRNLIGEKPIFGICLGHQLLGLAMGGSIYKLKFGHHGGNQPVKDLKTGQVKITVQNHNFAVDINSLEDKAVEVTHINLNDKSVEGMRHTEQAIFSIQYHPEASPGPHDANYLFDEFMEIVER